ncbi:MAG TPA: DUF3426 domain-containing protein, partial [Rhodocyclaceae bacterium]|nr:DUF3426 domain-containing protein [Rhodocyclaceae bacterium]
PPPDDVETQPPAEFAAVESPPPEGEPAESQTTPEFAALPNAEPLPEPVNETPEESARQAREAGMMAARELQETAAYDRWSAGTLVLDAHGRIVDGVSAGPVRWPFAVAVALLVLVLCGQIAHHFRTELVQRSPGLRSVFTALGSNIPLPRDADQVSIEASDLQADAARGLLVLQATLKNRSPYTQAWPALELTLTDSEDAVVTRRVLTAADYLPASADHAAFSGASEIGLRLWIESKKPAAGYRLYVFYP